MSLDNQRNLRLAFAMDPRFLAVAAGVAGEMNAWAEGFLGRPIVDDWRAPARVHDADLPGARPPPRRPPRPAARRRGVRGLHRRPRPVRRRERRRRCAPRAGRWSSTCPRSRSRPRRRSGRSSSTRSRRTSGCRLGRSASTSSWSSSRRRSSCSRSAPRSGRHFVGFNTGRWDYINSVSDALHGDPAFTNPNIDAITMTYAYMRAYEDRVRRAVNTPDAGGRFALWQGGMEAQIPVGSPAGVQAAMAQGGRRRGARAARGCERQVGRPLEDGPHRAARVGARRRGQPAGPRVPGADPHARGRGRARLAWSRRHGPCAAPVTCCRVGLQYGNAFLRGFQAAALKPADAFGDDDVLYLMEDMATGEIRLSILWEWLHKGAPFTDGDPETGRLRATRSRPRCSPGCSRRSTRSSSRPTGATSTTTRRHDAADRPRDRRGLRPRRGQAHLVHRPAQSQPRQRRPRRSPASGSPPTSPPSTRDGTRLTANPDFEA